MARRGKPLPTRRGRVRTETTVTEVTDTAAEPAAAEAEVVEETRVTTRTAAAPAGGLEMALIVVTLVALIAAFLMLQVEMRSAFGEGWPI